VSWTAPSNAVDSAIDSYRVRTFVGDGTTAILTKTVAATGTSTQITTLTNGTDYRFDVTASRGAVTGPASTKSALVRPVSQPGKATIGKATSGKAGGKITATARWSPPTSYGGSALTGYKVTALRLNAAGAILGSTTSTLRPVSARALVMTLPRTGRYAFRVVAINAVGSSAASARSNVVNGR
jgi:hypothetical protein